MLNFAGKDDFVWWTGVVEDVENDPLQIGRVRVRIYGHYDDDIAVEELPWASPVMPISSASIGGIGQSPTGVMVGSWVMGFFRDSHGGQDPIIWGTLPGRKLGANEGQSRNNRGREVPSTLQDYSSKKAAGVPTTNTGVVENAEPTPLSDVAASDAASADLVSFLKKKEGYSSTSYWDHKQHSIGYGTKANFAGEVIDEAEAERRLEQNIGKYRGYVLDREKKYGYSWNERQRDALTSFAYNLGPGALDTLTANGTRDNETIASKMLLYNKASGKTIDALATRRQEERAMFLSGGTDLPSPALSPDTTEEQREQRADSRVSQQTIQQSGSTNTVGNVSTTDNSQATQSTKSDLPERSGLVEEPETEEHEKKEDLTTNSKFTEPASPYAAQYPYNNATKSRSGHLIEIDDTPGNERIHTFHRSGSFEEYHPDGKRVNKTVGEGYELVLGNKNLHVKGNLTIVVDGNYNIVVAGKSTSGVGGTTDVTSGGNHTIKAPKIDLNP